MLNTTITNTLLISHRPYQNAKYRTIVAYATNKVKGRPIRNANHISVCQSDPHIQFSTVLHSEKKATYI